MTEQPAPLVSVCIITYNHERFLRETLESVLAQKTNFPFEIVIGEDLSIDGTRDIVLEYAEKYPQTIRAVLSTSNIGANGNLIRTMALCRGRYIAMVEGDDLPISEDKLQKQVDLLEEHPDCALCSHRAEVYSVDSGQVTRVWPDFQIPAITTIDDLLRQNYIAPCSVMYRNILKKIPGGFERLSIGDWPLHILHAQKGNIGFLDETLSQYRKHSTGVFSPLTALQQTEAVLQSREFMYPQLATEQRRILGPVILEYCYQIAGMHLENRDTGKARHSLARGFKYYRHFGLYNGRRLYFRRWLQVFLPRVYALFYKAGR